MYPIDQKIKKNERKHTKIKQHGFLQLFMKSELSFPILNKTNVSKGSLNFKILSIIIDRQNIK